LLWSRLVSWDAAGYLMGVCCVETQELPLAELNGIGLQAPHGYTIIKTVEYGSQRLIHLRNPIGERSVRVWQGSWRFTGMTPEAKRDLKVVNVNGDFLLHPKADFFITFAEFIKYCTLLEVCRSNDWPAVSHTAWLRQGLDSAFTGFRLRWFPSTTTESSTLADISMYQEVGKVRQLTANFALGFALIPESPIELTPPAASGEELCTQARRRGEVSLETHLRANTSYLIVPLSFSQIAENRKITLTVHTPQPSDLVLTSVRLNPEELNRGIFAHLKKHGKQTLTSVPGLTVFLSQVPGVGCVLAAENAGFFPIVIAIDALDSQVVEASRGSLMTEDTLAPGHRAVLQILRFKTHDSKIAYSTGMRMALDAGVDTCTFFPPALDGEPYHVAVKIINKAETLLKHYVNEGLDIKDAAAVAIQELMDS
jgi:hypothetical protein